MTMLMAAVLAVLSPQDVVVEMNDGVRELQVGKTGVRVEVRNRGTGGPSAPVPGVRGATGTKRMFDEGGHAKVWT
jgi:hypothetical protein